MGAMMHAEKINILRIKLSKFRTLYCEHATIACKNEPCLNRLAFDIPEMTLSVSIKLASIKCKRLSQRLNALN